MSFSFFYADVEASPALLSRYTIDDWIHANNGVVASRLRGGLLHGCDVRFSFITNISLNADYRIEDMDYKNQGLYIFEDNLYFRVLDKFHIGNKAQILMSPLNDIEDYGLLKIIRAARADFRELVDTEPAAELNNAEWKKRVAIAPGFNGKVTPHLQR